jgi:predicted component of type VI protein secretion system
MVSQSEGWRELRRQVAAKFRALNDEIRHYPRPIARCDEQLTRLIEQRDRVRALQERMTAVEACEPAAVQLDAILQEALEHQDFAITPALRALIRGSE